MTIRPHKRAGLRDIKNQSTKVYNNLVTSVTIRLHIRAILRNTINLFMKVRNISVKSVTIRQDQSNKLGNINLKSIGYMTNYKVPAYIDGK